MAQNWVSHLSSSLLVNEKRYIHGMSSSFSFAASIQHYPITLLLYFFLSRMRPVQIAICLLFCLPFLALPWPLPCPMCNTSKTRNCPNIWYKFPLSLSLCMIKVFSEERAVWKWPITINPSHVFVFDMFQITLFLRFIFGRAPNSGTDTRQVLAWTS